MRQNDLPPIRDWRARATFYRTLLSVQGIKINSGIYTYAAILNPLTLLKYKNRWPDYAVSIAEALKH